MLAQCLGRIDRANELFAALASQHTGLQLHASSNDDVIPLLGLLELVGLLQVALELCGLHPCLEELLPHHPIAVLTGTK